VEQHWGPGDLRDKFGKQWQWYTRVPFAVPEGEEEGGEATTEGIDGGDGGEGKDTGGTSPGGGSTSEALPVWRREKWAKDFDQRIDRMIGWASTDEIEGREKKLADKERDFTKSITEHVGRKVDKRIKIENPDAIDSHARCMICNKLFREKKFVTKHIENKHADVVAVLAFKARTVMLKKAYVVAHS
jgi:uncharacterized C2H2 Zn-finger protein